MLFFSVAPTGRRSRGDDLASNSWPLVAVLSEPRRREVYDFVAAHDTAVTRDDVAQGLSIERALAAFHLDKLADAGLLEVSFGRPAGRMGGPGAGRPSKLYVLSDAEVEISVPRRRYDIAGRILLRCAHRPRQRGRCGGGPVRPDGRRLLRGRPHTPRPLMPTAWLRWNGNGGARLPVPRRLASSPVGEGHFFLPVRRSVTLTAGVVPSMTCRTAV